MCVCWRNCGNSRCVRSCWFLSLSCRASRVFSERRCWKCVAARDAGQPVRPRKRPARCTDPYMPQIEQWVQESAGLIRGDVIHEKLRAGTDYSGSVRSTHRAVAAAKTAYRVGVARVHCPWVTEPGRWVQYDFGEGPVVDGKKTVLFVAWLAWSRYAGGVCVAEPASRYSVRRVRPVVHRTRRHPDVCADRCLS